MILKEKLFSSSIVELLKFNRPDCFFVVVGVTCSAVIGCVFPLMAILIGEVLRVSSYKIVEK